MRHGALALLLLLGTASTIEPAFAAAAAELQQEPRRERARARAAKAETSYDLGERYRAAYAETLDRELLATAVELYVTTDKVWHRSTRKLELVHQVNHTGTGARYVLFVSLWHLDMWELGKRFPQIAAATHDADVCGSAEVKSCVSASGSCVSCTTGAPGCDLQLCNNPTCLSCQKHASCLVSAAQGADKEL